MKDITPKEPIQPVIADTGCLGHIRFTCKGYSAYDASDKLLGTFAEAYAAVAAILNQREDGQACCE